jgi:glycosyltransferase involved in cell wall biosynthesis
VAPRNDIAIYSPFASIFYERSADGEGDRGGGGAELQTFLLARQLALRGLAVAHIVYPLERDPAAAHASLEVVERRAAVARRRRSALGKALGKLADGIHVWRALAAADARVYLFRTGLSGGSVGFVTGMLFCLTHRRQLVFAASNDLDFVFDRDDRPRLTESLYRFSLRRARRVIVQNRRQVELAGRLLDASRIDFIPSFAETGEVPSDTPDCDGFLWAGRLVEYKLPLRYLELAKAVPEARFLMIGAPTGETPKPLAANLAEEAALLPNLELKGTQSRDRLLELIARSTAVVVTSRYEGMPNLFLEAWARGIPVLSLHADPDGRITSQGLGVCARGSWLDFVEAAKRLWSDAGLRNELGKRGRDYVRSVHAVDVVADQWNRILRGMLD